MSKKKPTQLALTLEPDHERRPELTDKERDLIDRAIRCLGEPTPPVGGALSRSKQVAR
jgi:hypothetical protein